MAASISVELMATSAQWRRGSHVFLGGGQEHNFSDKQIFCDITNSVVHFSRSRKCSFD